MLQDIEVGKALEIEGLMGAVIEMVKLTDIDVRCTETVYSLIRLLDHTIQTERVHVKAQPV